MGRPSSYRDEYAEQARKLTDLGATDVELADFFEVSLTTIKNWKVEHAEFLAALKVGKEVADDRVERSLYQRAIGYSFDSVKVFKSKDEEPVIVPVREHVAPDTVACIFWLKNRRPELWRDMQHQKHSGEIGIRASKEQRDAAVSAALRSTDG